MKSNPVKTKSSSLVITLNYKIWELMSEADKKEFISSNNIVRTGYTSTGIGHIPHTVEFWK